MHSTTGVTDQFYSNMDDEEKKNRTDSMFIKRARINNISDEFREFLEWKISGDKNIS
jgi:hypothetical protein